jgi:23S rRNA (uridine2552-2'-O)-methyltransferase
MNEHVSDAYVKRAKMAGYRSRAAFKLIEANEKYQFLGKKMNVVDLGSAPGSWSQVLASLMDGNGNIFALDLLDMDPIKGVDFIQGDFREQGVLEILEKKLDKIRLDLVISDMAPNISGIKSADQAGIIYLNELALQFAVDWLKPKGNFLVKSFIGAEFDDYVREVKKYFKAVYIFKPKSSRNRSSEIFVYGKSKI